MQKLRLQIPERRRQLKSFSDHEVVCSTPVKGSRVITFTDTRSDSILETLRILALPFYDRNTKTFVPTCFTEGVIDNDYIFKQIQKDLGQDVVIIDSKLSTITTHAKGRWIARPNLVSNTYGARLSDKTFGEFVCFSVEGNEGPLTELVTDEVFIFNYDYLPRNERIERERESRARYKRYHLQVLEEHAEKETVLSFPEVYLIPPTITMSLSLPAIGTTLSSMARANRLLNMTEVGKFRGFTKLSSADKQINLETRLAKFLVKYNTKIQDELDKVEIGIRSKTDNYQARTRQVEENYLSTSPPPILSHFLVGKNKDVFEKSLSKYNLIQKALIHKLDLDIKFNAKVDVEDQNFVKSWITLLLVRRIITGQYGIRYSNSCEARHEYDYHTGAHMVPMATVESYLKDVPLSVYSKHVLSRIPDPKKIKKKKKSNIVTALDTESDAIYNTLMSNPTNAVDDILKALKEHVK